MDVTFHVVEDLIISGIKQLKCKRGKCGGVKKHVSTSTNCVPNPTVK